MARRAPQPPTTNRQAIDVVIAALAAAGRLEPADEALVVAARSLAHAVDADPGNASLWREYRAIEQRLRSTGEGSTSGIEAALAALRAPVGDASHS